MSATLKEKNIPDNWKEKYHRTLNDLDEKTKEWKTEENNLYKSILRLILIHSGVSPELDKELQTMRDTLRKGADGVTRKNIISGVIEKTFLHVQKVKEKNGPDNDHGQTFLSFLNQLNLPDTYAKGLKDIQQRISDNPDKNEFQSCIDQLVSLINDVSALSDTDKQHVEIKGDDAFYKLLQKLSFPGEVGSEIRDLRKRVVEIEEQQEQLEVVDELVRVLQRLYKDTLADDDNEQKIDFDQLKESLFQLIEWLPLSKQYDKKIQDIKNQLTNLSDEDDLKKLFLKIAALINDFQSSLQEELYEVQGFLKNVTLRLKDIETHIHQVSLSEQESKDDSTALNKTVQENVNNIRDDIEQATNIEDIKRSINKHLMVIEQSMGDFIKAEQDRREKSERHVKKLNKRLVDMKQEASELQQKIREERDKAQIDALTGIPNRLAYDERISQEFNRWQRYDQPLSVCVVDIDKFKNVNDTYGHKAGDKVLMTVAELCDSRIRDADFFARYGGEEFVLILPQTDLKKALVVAENLRREVDDCTFHYAQEPVAITISCGLAEFSADDTIESVFMRADRALYTAKNAGRNQSKTENDI